MTDEKSEKPEKQSKKPDLQNVFTFSIDVKVQSGERFEGTFTVHRPTIGEMIKIGNNEARELEGLNNVDMMTNGLARMVATLDVVIDKKPLWWKPRELRDLEVIQEVYQKYIDFLAEFQRKP